MNNNNNNPIQMVMSFMESGGNPQVLAQQIVNQNPQMVQMISQVKNMAGNKTPKEFAMQLAKQNGMNPKQIENLFNKMGSK